MNSRFDFCCVSFFEMFLGDLQLHRSCNLIGRPLLSFICFLLFFSSLNLFSLFFMRCRFPLFLKGDSFVLFFVFSRLLKPLISQVLSLFYIDLIFFVVVFFSLVSTRLTGQSICPSFSPASCS